MIEKIISFLTSKESIDNSKIISTLKYLLIAILASHLFSIVFYKYTISLDIRFLIEFIFSGKILLCILSYGIIYLSCEFVSAILYYLYSKIIFKKTLKLADKTVNKEGKIKIQRDFIRLKNKYKPLFIQLGIFQFDNKRLIIHKDLIKIIKNYCAFPRDIVVNLIHLVVVSLLFFITFKIAITNLTFVPSWLMSFVNVIFWSIISIITILFIVNSIFEVNIPFIKRLYKKVKIIK